MLKNKAPVDQEPFILTVIKNRAFSPGSYGIIKQKMKEEIKVIANNRKARHDYFITEELEAGIALAGTEVKSVRMGHCSIKESYITIRGNDVIINGMHISPYEKGNIFNRDPLRPRRLLLNRSEIRKLDSRLKEKGYTLIPLSVYIKKNLIKVNIGLAKGKKLYDKRNDIAKKDAKREAEREFKNSSLRF